jgi:hypothetical protein
MLFVGALTVTKRYSTIIKKEQDRIIEVNQILSRFSLTMTTFYQLLLYNGSSTIKNNPVNDEWEATYENLARVNDFFIDLRNDADLYDEDIKKIVDKNLCEFLLVDPAYECHTTGKRSAAQGITGVNHYYLNRIRSFKDTWDDSDKSIAIAQGILSNSDFWDIENTYYYLLITTYKDLSSRLTKEFDHTMTNYKAASSSLFWISQVLIVIIGLCLLKLFFVGMTLERKMIREMIRLIPLPIVMKNRYLRTYLISHCNGILDSIKARL